MVIRLFRKENVPPDGKIVKDYVPMKDGQVEKNIARGLKEGNLVAVELPDAAPEPVALKPEPEKKVAKK